MRRIAKGPVRGISFKLQEEERERKDNYVPAVSALEVDFVEIDTDTNDMLKAMGMSAIQGLQVVQLSSIQEKRPAFRPDERGPRGEGREGGRGGRGEGGRGGRGDKGGRGEGGRGGRGFGRGDKGGRGGRGEKGGRGFGRSGRGGGGNTESTEKASS